VTGDQIRLDQTKSDLDFPPDLEPDILGKEEENNYENLIELLIKRDNIQSSRPVLIFIPTNPLHHLCPVILKSAWPEISKYLLEKY
jgi:hypothetical protein